MQAYIINMAVCPGCAECAARKACTTRAIVWLGEGESAYIELERCHGCGKCVHACQHAAIEPLLRGGGPGTMLARW